MIKANQNIKTGAALWAIFLIASLVQETQGQSKKEWKITIFYEADMCQKAYGV